MVVEDANDDNDDTDREDDNRLELNESMTNGDLDIRLLWQRFSLKKVKDGRLQPAVRRKWAPRCSQQLTSTKQGKRRAVIVDWCELRRVVGCGFVLSR